LTTEAFNADYALFGISADIIGPTVNNSRKCWTEVWLC